MSWLTVLLIMVVMAAVISGATYLLRNLFPGFKNFVMAIALAVAGAIQAFDAGPIIAGLDPQTQGLIIVAVAIIQAALRAITSSPIFKPKPMPPTGLEASRPPGM